jgi:phospho-N-acetylmuramoyl-pentapeptide-transferase
VIAILVAAMVAFIASIAGTPLVIRYFRGRGFGQMIREEGPDSHQAKAGTPTMGGTAIVGAALLGFLAARFAGVRVTPTGLLVLGTFVAMAGVGFADDLIKLRMRRSLGLTKTTKFVGQGLIALVFGIVGPNVGGIEREISVVGDITVSIPSMLFLFWVFIMLTGVSNAVNLTDGLDGLAAGSSVLVFSAFTVMAFWQFRHPEAYGIEPDAARDIAVISAAVMASLAGFLWHNAPPAAIFMGDTGSLALGGLMAALAMASGTQVLLLALGGLFVAETLSVIIQVFSYRVFGRRVFRMAPMHHHFELLGWAETTVIVRFWIVAGMGVALGLGLFYAEFLNRVGTGG